MKSGNEVFILSEKLGILHEHCREAFQEESHDRFYDLLHNYQQLIRDEIERCLGTSNHIKIFSPHENRLYPSTFIYFRKEILWHTIEFSIFLSLSQVTIVPREDNGFLYPSELAVMFTELLDASLLKQCVLSDVMLAEAIQRRETTTDSVNQFNHLAEKSAYKWRVVLSALGDLDKEQELTDTQYLHHLPDILRVYLTNQSEYFSIENIRALVSPTESPLTGVKKQASNLLNTSLQMTQVFEIQNSLLVPYQEDRICIDYFSESSALSEECHEEMMVWLILLSSEVLLHQKIDTSFNENSISRVRTQQSRHIMQQLGYVMRLDSEELLQQNIETSLEIDMSADASSIREWRLQQLDYLVRRVANLLALFSARNNQLEVEIERKLSNVEEHVNIVTNAVEKLYSFTEDARKWTMQLMIKPETCDSRSAHFEFESSMMVSTTREEVPEERLIVLTSRPEAPGYSQSLSLFRITDQAYEESPQQKLKNLQEKLRQLFRDCQAERVYLKELLYVRFNQESGLDLCEKIGKEQSADFQRTKNDFELAIGEWQVWQKTMFGYMAEFERDIFEKNEKMTDSNLGGPHAGKEFRK
ncbi:MAG: hypothetical protein CK424_02870 [Legionella sp.]|nr:MAG: hypothetical protein CK424_02870 [Legionella sp.]